MGYTTDFTGAFSFSSAILTPAEAAYLAKFAATRRMKRDASKLTRAKDPLRKAVKLPLGVEGGYYVGSEEEFGMDFSSASVLDHNGPPKGQPGLWCQWIPLDDGAGIAWDGGEKFYYYVEWLEYLIAHFLKPWGRVLEGEVTWQGEDPSDIGKIIVRANVVTTAVGRIVFDESPQQEVGREARPNRFGYLDTEE